MADYKQVVSVSVIGGRGYTDGTRYVWTSSGGGCSVNAQGTVDVIGGALTNGVVENEGLDCTSRPTISVPAAAGSGRGGRIVPSVYQLTPHNAGTTYNLPGVDYPVGYDTTLTLRDPTESGNLPPCASYANNLVTINSSDCALNGFDFTLHDTNLNVKANLTDVLISNNKFIANANNTNAMITISSGSCDVTIKYNQLDGGATSSLGSSFNLIASVHSACYSGRITFEYNYCFNIDSKCLNLGGHPTAPSILWVTEQFNMFSQIGLCSKCSHGEAEYSYSGFTSGAVFERISPWTMKFNVAFTFYSHAPSNATSQMAIEADAVDITNADVEYNYILVPGPYGARGSNNSGTITSSAAMYCGYQENGTNSSGTMLHNLLDFTGAYFPYNPSSGTCSTAFPSVSDLNAVTGHSCNPRTCN